MPIQTRLLNHNGYGTLMNNSRILIRSMATLTSPSSRPLHQPIQGISKESGMKTLSSSSSSLPLLSFPLSVAGLAKRWPTSSGLNISYITIRRAHSSTRKSRQERIHVERLIPNEKSDIYYKNTHIQRTLLESTFFCSPYRPTYFGPTVTSNVQLSLQMDCSAQ